MTGGTVADVWQGLTYLPLPQSKFLQIYCTLSGLRAALPSIRHAALLYRNSVVWCDVSLESLCQLMHYLHYTGVMQSKDPDISQSTPQSYQESFIGGMGSCRTIFLNTALKSRVQTGHNVEKCSLILYKYSSVIIPIILPSSEKLTSSLYEKIYHLLDSRVCQLCDMLKESSPESKLNSDVFQFVYHNSMNLAIKSNISVEKQPPHLSPMNPEPGKSSWWFAKSPSPAEDTEDLEESVTGAFRLGEGNSLVTFSPDESSKASSVVPWVVMHNIINMQHDMNR